MAKLEKAKIFVEIIRIATDVYVVFADKKKDSKIKKLEEENAELKKKLDEKNKDGIESKDGTIPSDTPPTSTEGY